MVGSDDQSFKILDLSGTIGGILDVRIQRRLALELWSDGLVHVRWSTAFPMVKPYAVRKPPLNWRLFWDITTKVGLGRLPIVASTSPICITSIDIFISLFKHQTIHQIQVTLQHITTSVFLCLFLCFFCLFCLSLLSLCFVRLLFFILPRSRRWDAVPRRCGCERWPWRRSASCVGGCEKVKCFDVQTNGLKTWLKRCNRRIFQSKLRMVKTNTC